MKDSYINDILLIEIEKKYGVEAVQDLKAKTSEEKRKQIKESYKRFLKKEREKRERSEKIEVDGFLMPKKLITIAKEERICPKCKILSFDRRDDIYMNRFNCCLNCYIQYYEGKEDVNSENRDL